MNISFISQRPVALKSIDLASGFLIRTKAISHAGRTLVEAIYAVAATRGSFPMRQFKVVQRNDPIQRRFLFNWLNGASSYMAFHESRRCSILSWASEIPPSRLSAAA